MRIIAIPLCLALLGGVSGAATEPVVLEGAALSAHIAELDRATFDAFNHCADPARLAEHASYFDPAVEFYHDDGGVTWTRDAMLANTARHVCGKFSRELVPGTLRVHRIKDFGALAVGTHRFCQFASKRCEGEADFAVLWREDAGVWRITRVLSYGHRPAP